MIATVSIPGLPRFSAAARRVRAAEVTRDESFVKPDGLDYCLDCWKRWMHGDADRDLGAKTMRGLVGDGDGYGSGQTVYDAQQLADSKIAAATDAMIDSLSVLHRWAIYRTCSITSAWRFPNADLTSVGVEARAELEKKLRQNPCTAMQF